MPRVPETRASLILRLPSSADAEAWGEFVSIYEPFLYRFGRRGGLQDADANELVQNVMMSVARAVGRWKPDGDRGRFRTWLFRIARNQLIDTLQRRKQQFSVQGLSGFVSALDRNLMTGALSESEIARSHRQELFLWAAERVKNSVREVTWQAFWKSAVEECDVEQVAAALNLTTGAVYIARSRVLAKLRDEVRKWESDDAL